MRFDFYDELDLEEIDSLWKQGVCMDDWDYVVFFEAKYKAEFPLGWDRISVSPSNYNIQRLLSGGCSNEWWLVENFRGKKGILGVVYHA